MAQIKLHIKTITNTAIVGAKVEFDLNQLGTVNKYSDKDGNVLITDLPTGTFKANIQASTFNIQPIVLTIDNKDAIVQKDIIMLSSKTVEDNKAEIVGHVGTVVEKIVQSFDWMPPKDFNDAKKKFKDLQENIESQKNVLEEAFKNGANDIIQTQSANLIYTAKKSLEGAMTYYLEERKKYANVTSSWINFRNWCECTSMIGAIYLLRENLVTYINKIIEKLQSI